MSKMQFKETDYYVHFEGLVSLSLNHRYAYGYRLQEARSHDSFYKTVRVEGIYEAMDLKLLALIDFLEFLESEDIPQGVRFTLYMVEDLDRALYLNENTITTVFRVENSNKAIHKWNMLKRNGVLLVEATHDEINRVLRAKVERALTQNALMNDLDYNPTLYSVCSSRYFDEALLEITKTPIVQYISKTHGGQAGFLKKIILDEDLACMNDIAKELSPGWPFDSKLNNHIIRKLALFVRDMDACLLVTPAGEEILSAPAPDIWFYKAAVLFNKPILVFDTITQEWWTHGKKGWVQKSINILSYEKVGYYTNRTVVKSAWYRIRKFIKRHQEV